MLNVGVYLTSKDEIDPVYHDAIKELANVIGQNDMHMIYGGMVDGLMGRLLAFTLAARAKVTSIIRCKPDEPLKQHYLLDETDMHVVGTFSERKKKVAALSDVIVIFPGAYGTLDEALSTLYWGARGFHNKPVVFLNIKGFWDSLQYHLNSMGENSDYLRQSVHFVDTVDSFLSIAKDVQKQKRLLMAHPDEFNDFETDILLNTDALLIDDASRLGKLQTLAAALVLRQMRFTLRDIKINNAHGQFDFIIEQINRALEEKMMSAELRSILQVVDLNLENAPSTRAHQKLAL